MKVLKKIVALALFGSLYFTISVCQAPFTNYDPDYVNISSVLHDGDKYKLVYMKRGESGNRIKVKYFGARDFDGTSVPDRFIKWSKGKNIICLSSGGYMDNTQTPVGLTVDNGIEVNNNLKEFDGLVIVYATGGVVATNLKNGDLNIKSDKFPQGKVIDLRKKPMDKGIFMQWCKEESATVFQTHLLAYKNQLTIGTNSEQTKRERRFLAVGTEDGKVVHVIAHNPSYTSLYEGSRRTLKFLKEFKGMEVTFMINLDPGAQDVFFLFDKNGQINKSIVGTVPIEDAANLLVYYYE